MLDIDLDFMYHKLTLLPHVGLIAKRKRKLKIERRVALEEDVAQLTRVGLKK